MESAIFIISLMSSGEIYALPIYAESQEQAIEAAESVVAAPDTLVGCRPVEATPETLKLANFVCHVGRRFTILRPAELIDAARAIALQRIALREEARRVEEANRIEARRIEEDRIAREPRKPKRTSKWAPPDSRPGATQCEAITKLGHRCEACAVLHGTVCGTHGGDARRENLPKWSPLYNHPRRTDGEDEAVAEVISLPVPVVEYDTRSLQDGTNHYLSDEIDRRARATMQWAPWARRARHSRRYEGLSR
jgi:hypothetical protein